LPQTDEKHGSSDSRRERIQRKCHVHTTQPIHAFLCTYLLVLWGSILCLAGILLTVV